MGSETESLGLGFIAIINIAFISEIEFARRAGGAENVCLKYASSS